MMDILCAIVLAPAATFLVFAVALGAKSPLRWAAWGAICGPLAFAAVLVSEQHSPQQAAWQQAPIYTPSAEQLAKPGPFDDLIPPQPYKVPLKEQYRLRPGSSY
jgi:hypothetical protein